MSRRTWDSESDSDAVEEFTQRYLTKSKLDKKHRKTADGDSHNTSSGNEGRSQTKVSSGSKGSFNAYKQPKRAQGTEKQFPAQSTLKESETLESSEGGSDGSDEGSDSDEDNRLDDCDRGQDDSEDSTSSGDDDKNNDGPEEIRNVKRSKKIKAAQKESSEDAYAQLRKGLSDLPFNELQKLKDKIGVKTYNMVVFGSKSGTKKQIFKRANRNRPIEISAKHPVSRHMQVMPGKKKVSRDPRFDDLSGEYDESSFNKDFSFLGDIKQREKQKLLKQLKKERNEDKKKEISQYLRNMTQQEKLKREKEMKLLRQRELKKQERQLVQQGKRPFYLKTAERKMLELADKYKDLSKSGKLDKFMAKKRKKTAAKDRRHLPKTPFDNS